MGLGPGAGNVMVRCARESDRERLLLDVVGGTREKPRRTVCAMRVDVGRSNKDGRAARRDAFAIRFAIDTDRLYIDNKHTTATTKKRARVLYYYYLYLYYYYYYYYLLL